MYHFKFNYIIFQSETTSQLYFTLGTQERKNAIYNNFQFLSCEHHIWKGWENFKSFYQEESNGKVQIETSNPFENDETFILVQIGELFLWWKLCNTKLNFIQHFKNIWTVFRIERKRDSLEDEAMKLWVWFESHMLYLVLCVSYEISTAQCKIQSAHCTLIFVFKCETVISSVSVCCLLVFVTNKISFCYSKSAKISQMCTNSCMKRRKSKDFSSCFPRSALLHKFEFSCFQKHFTLLLYSAKALENEERKLSY